MSRRIHEILNSFSPLVEPLSLDEAFVDVRGCEPLVGSAVEIANRIKREIREHVRLSRVTERSMERLGLRTIGDVRIIHFSKLAQGIDDRKVIPDREAKSISHETTFPVDIADDMVLRATLQELVEQVAWRVRHHDRRGRTVQLKVLFSDFRTITREATLSEATDIIGEICQAVFQLLDNCGLGPEQPLWLLGVGLGGFSGEEPCSSRCFQIPPVRSCHNLTKFQI